MTSSPRHPSRPVRPYSMPLWGTKNVWIIGRRVKVIRVAVLVGITPGTATVSINAGIPFIIYAVIVHIDLIVPVVAPPVVILVPCFIPIVWDCVATDVITIPRAAIIDSVSVFIGVRVVAFSVTVEIAVFRVV